MWIIICCWCARYVLIQYMIDSSRTNTRYTMAQKKFCQLICRTNEYTKGIFSFPLVLRPVDGSWPPLMEALRSHTDTLQTTLGRTLLDEGPIPDNMQHSQDKNLHAPSAWFEPAIPARKRQQIHRAATAISNQSHDTFNRLAVELFF